VIKRQLQELLFVFSFFSEAIHYYLLPSEKKCPSGTDLMDTIIENVKHSTPIVLQIKT
jgi:hypothetical protein